MVKLSNKGKGKPSKRKTLKTKYKIQRKVRQHKKKVRKQMRKLGQKNIKPRNGDKTNTLPNSFPFKAQILQNFKNQIPKQDIASTQKLVPQQWGLFALENRSVYLTQDKDHLTKKYITNFQKLLQYANVAIQVVDARNIQACLCQKMHQQLNNKSIHHIIVVSKIDTVSQKKLQKIKKKLQQKKLNYCIFTNDQKRKNILLDQIHTKIKQVNGVKKCVVIGKANTGKHTLIKHFMKLAKFHNQDYATISSVLVSDNLYIVDTPYRVEDETKYPLFHLPLSVHEDSIAVQEQRLAKYLFIDNMNPKHRNDFIMHYGIQDYVTLDDLFKKIGKANRVFGKGGMVNVAAVRTSVLTDWFQGKLNYIFE